MIAQSAQSVYYLGANGYSPLRDGMYNPFLMKFSGLQQTVNFT